MNIKKKKKDKSEEHAYPLTVPVTSRLKEGSIFPLIKPKRIKRPERSSMSF